MTTRDKNSQLLFDGFNKLDIGMNGTMPAVIYIETVKGCFYSCAMCYTHNLKPVLIKKNLLKMIEPYFKYLEVLAIHGSGEPLMGDIPYFIEQSIKNEFVLHMNTTGFSLNKELSDMLMKTRLSMRFSIHAGSGETYKRIMGHNFERIIKNIEYIVNKSVRDNKNNDFWFSFIVMKENIDEIENFLHIAHACGIRKVRFMRLKYSKSRRMPDRNFEFNYFDQNSKNVRTTFFTLLPQYKKLAEKLNITIEAGTMLSDAKNLSTAAEFVNNLTGRLLHETKIFPIRTRKGVCIMPWFGQLIICQDGNVYLCCGTSYHLGNLYDNKLEDIWNSEKMQTVRKSFSKNRASRKCGYCQAKGFSEYPNNSFQPIER